MLYNFFGKSLRNCNLIDKTNELFFKWGTVFRSFKIFGCYNWECDYLFTLILYCSGEVL